MKPSLSESKLSDEELATFLEELELNPYEKSDNLKWRDPSYESSKEPSLPELSYFLKPKKKPWFWKVVGLVTLFLAGVSVGWFVKPPPPQPRSLEVINEEIFHLINEFRAIYLQSLAPDDPSQEKKSLEMDSYEEQPGLDLPSSEKEDNEIIEAITPLIKPVA